MKTVVTVDGMMCEHCAKRVETAIKSVNGVENCEVNLKKKTAVIKSTEALSAEEITKVVTDAGYTVMSVENK